MPIAYTVADVARMFGVSDPTVRRWHNAGTIQGHVTSDGKLMFAPHVLVNHAHDIVTARERDVDDAHAAVETARHELDGALIVLRRLERIATNDGADSYTREYANARSASFAEEMTDRAGADAHARAHVPTLPEPHTNMPAFSPSFTITDR